MSYSKVPSSFITDFFKEFYAQLLLCKQTALELVEPIEPLSKDGEISQKSPSQIQEQCRFIQRELRFLLEEQSIKSAKQVGDFTRAQYEEAQYIMVALADEIFLNLSWLGVKEWEQTILEGQIFHTQVAGELFFSKCEDFIKANDPLRKDLAVIYLTALSLGFQGKYRGKENKEKIAWYKKHLYLLINQKPSDLYHSTRSYLLENCYRYALSESISRGLPDIRLWNFSFLAVLGAYLFITYVLWYKMVRDMNEAVGFIVDQTQYLLLS